MGVKEFAELDQRVGVIRYLLSFQYQEDLIKAVLRAGSIERLESPYIEWINDTSTIPSYALEIESNNNKSAESAITKAGRNAINVALAKLDDIPMIDDKHIAVPWPITERPKLDPEVWEESEIKSVTIADLYASQELLTKERVVFFIENPGAIELGRRTFANVYDLGERLVIVDGHHRLAAMWLLGADAANVWFLEE